MGSVNVHNSVAHLPNVCTSLSMLTVLQFHVNVRRWQYSVFHIIVEPNVVLAAEYYVSFVL